MYIARYKRRLNQIFFKFMTQFAWAKLVDTLGIKPYTITNHDAVFTMEAMAAHSESIPGIILKNLVLKEKKTDQLFMLSTMLDTKTDLNKLAESLGTKALRFADLDDVCTILHVTPGSVTPLSLVYDTNIRIRYLLDSRLKDTDLVAVHPVEPDHNRATWSLLLSELKMYLMETHHAPEYVAL